MIFLRELCALGLVAAIAACGAPETGPPEILLDRTVCAHCGMLISELRYAAAYRPEPGAQARAFDDLGCFATALASEPESAILRAWLRDFETEEWLAANEAIIVHSDSLATPMGGGMVAVRGSEAAARLAADLDGASTLTFDQLLEGGRQATER